MQEPFYTISYTEGKAVFNEALTRFSDFYGMELSEVLVHIKYLRPAAFRNELQKYAVQYGKTSDAVMAHEYSNGITLPADGRYIVLVKYEQDESDTAEKIREITYHELGHVLSLYQTNLRHPNREAAFQNPKDKNTEILLNVGEYVWQEFIAKYLAMRLLTADSHRMIFDLRNREDLFTTLTKKFRMNPDNNTCYEDLTDTLAAALNSSISEYMMPNDCRDKLPELLLAMYSILRQHCVYDADYTADAEFTEALGYYVCSSLIEARKHPLEVHLP